MAVSPGMMNHLPKDFPQVYMPFLTEILLKKPANIPEFAAEYFERKVRERDGLEGQTSLPPSRIQLLQQQQASGSRESIPPKHQTSSKVEEMLAWRKPEMKLPPTTAEEDQIVEIKHLFEPETDGDFDENDEDVKSYVFVGKVLPVHSKTKQVHHSLEPTMLPPAIQGPSTHLTLPEPEDYYKESSALSLQKMKNDQQDIEGNSDRKSVHSIKTHGSVSEVEYLPVASKSEVPSYTSLLSKQDAAMDMSEKKVEGFRQHLEAPTITEATQTESGFTLLEIKHDHEQISNRLELEKYEDREVDSSVLESGFIPSSPADTSDSGWFEEKKTEQRRSIPVVPKVKIEPTSFEYERDEQEEGRFSITSMERHPPRLSRDRSEEAEKRYSIGSISQSALEAGSGGIVPTGASGLRSLLFQQSIIKNRLSGDLTTQEEDESPVTVSSLGYIQSRPFDKQEFLDREESDFGDDDRSAFDSDSSTTSILGERGIRSLWFQKRLIKDEKQGRLLTMTGRRGIMRKDSVQKLIVEVPVFQHHLIETTATTPRLGFRGFRAFLFVQAMEKEEKNLKLFKDNEEYILN